MIETERAVRADAPGDLPDGWRWTMVAEIGAQNGQAVLTGPFGADLGTRDFTAAGVPVLTIGCLTDRGLDLSKAQYVSEEKAKEIDRYRLRTGDILFSRMASVGRCEVVTPLLAGAIINYHLMRLRLTPDLVDPEFFMYYVRESEVVREYVRRINRGSTRDGINSGQLMQLPVALPLLSTQRRIAAALRDQMAAVERARAAAQAQIEAARALPAAYLHAVFESDEARAWPRVRLGDVCNLRPSKSVANNGDTVVRAITTACLSEIGFRPDGMKPARMWARDAQESCVSVGEILVARSNTPDLVGRAAMFNGEAEDAVASDLTIRLWPTPPRMGPFLTAYLSFLFVTGYWKARAGGASGTMKKITRTQLLESVVPLPDERERSLTAGRLSRRMAEVERLRASLEMQVGEIDALPAALLRRAFSGEM